MAPFTLGAPKDTDPSQVVIAADMKVKNGILQIKGETFSFNNTIDAALKKAAQTYRPIKHLREVYACRCLGGYLHEREGRAVLADDAEQSQFADAADGHQPGSGHGQYHRSVDGDMSIVMPALSGDNMKMQMAASWLTVSAG